MSDFEKHIEQVYIKFNYTINNYQILKNTFSKYKGLSQKQIGKILDRSTSYVSSTIRTYNYRENRQKCTDKINYFFQYEKITDAEYIQILLKMIKDTEINPYIALKNNQELSKIYNIHTYLVDSYSKYIFNGLKRTEYEEMIKYLPIKAT